MCAINRHVKISDVYHVMVYPILFIPTINYIVHFFRTLRNESALAITVLLFVFLESYQSLS